MALLDLDHVYLQEADAVFTFLSRFGVRDAEVEDALHDTFVLAMRTAKRFDSSRPIRPWLLGIAYRVAVARSRLGQSREDLVEVPEREDPRQDPERAVLTRQAGALAERALKTVPEEQRSVVVLHDLQGVPMADIAEATAAPLATAYSRLRLGRVAFERELKRLQGLSGGEA